MAPLTWMSTVMGRDGLDREAPGQERKESLLVPLPPKPQVLGDSLTSRTSRWTSGRELALGPSTDLPWAGLVWRQLGI